MRKVQNILLAAAASLSCYLYAEGPVAAGLAVLSLAAVLWLTEAIHISATALLIPIMAVLLGVLDVREALVSFANPVVYLFLGGFALAAALRTHRLDLWLAQQLMRVAGGRVQFTIPLIFASTAFISMWISNTATTAMMLPLVLGLLKPLHLDRDRNASIFVLLGVAYSANVGGLGTLVGSPPNAIAASILGMNFLDWLYIGLPMMLLLLPLVWVVLFLILRPSFEDSTTLLPSAAMAFTWTVQAKAVLAVFAVIVMLWLSSSLVAPLAGIESDFDALVGLLAVVLLVGSGLLPWRQLNDTTDWGVLILFGGGITLSLLLGETGTSRFLADGMVGLTADLPAWALMLAAVTLMVFLTEVASNTASAALLIPVFYAIPADAPGFEPAELAVAIAVAASCAFMLPVATPPNALVYGTGLVPQRAMIRAGLLINLTCIPLITLYMQWAR